MSARRWSRGCSIGHRPDPHPGGHLPDGAPAPGTEITAGGKVLGTTGSVAGLRGLALVRIDRLGDALAAGETPLAGAHPVRLERPGYATFAMPEGAASAAG